MEVEEAEGRYLASCGLGRVIYREIVEMSEEGFETVEEAKRFIRWYQSRALAALNNHDDERLRVALRMVRLQQEGKGDE